MDELLFKTIDTYYNVLEKTGYLSENLVEKIFVLDFLKSLKNNPEFPIMATPREKDLVAKLYNCVIENNCLI